MRNTPNPTLIADIGATNGRFGVVIDGDITAIKSFDVAGFESAESLIQRYLRFLEKSQCNKLPTKAAIAIAGPVINQRGQLTNLPWRVSSDELKSQFGFEGVHLLNDFEAIAWSISTLGVDGIKKIGQGTDSEGTTIGIIGPGSGVGISSIIFTDAGRKIITTEGGHATIPTVTEFEGEVVSYLREQLGHVSIEDVLCGKGFVRLYQAVSEIGGRTPLKLTPAEVTEKAQAGSCADCQTAFSVYCSLLGSVTGNLALTFGAQGGMFLAGGILPRFTKLLAQSTFRSRFEDKGRFQGYLAKISTSVIVHPHPGLLGVANRVAQFQDTDDKQGW